MEKTCANHPESLALAACKACEKAICLMCVHDEREGTFCSEGCIRNFREVSDWVGPAGEAPPAPAPAPSPAASSGSVFEEMPEHSPAAVEAAPEPQPEPVAEAAPEPEPAPEAPAPVPAAKTIGNPCYQHADIRAKAFCTRCRRAICGLCIVENPAGMFCSDECAKNLRGRRGGSPALKVAAALVLLAAAAGAVYAVKPELFGLTPEAPPTVENRVPPKPPVKPPPPKEPVKPPTPTPEPPKPPPEPPKPDPTEVVKTPPDAPTETAIEVVKITRPVTARPEAPKPTRFVTAWSQESPGNWYRVRRQEDGKPVFLDVGLKSRDAEASILLTQKHAGGRSGPVSEKRENHQTVTLLGEETISLEDRSYLCEIRQSEDGSSRQWVLVQGRHAGAVLRSEGPDGRFVADRLWENPVRVGLRVYDCLVVEGTFGEGGRRMKTWYSPTFPMGAVRLEIDGSTVAQAVDAGMSWDERPGAPK